MKSARLRWKRHDLYSRIEKDHIHINFTIIYCCNCSILLLDFLVFLIFLIVQLLSHVRLFSTIWATACQTPQSMGFSRQQYRTCCRFFLQGIFPTQELNQCLHCSFLLVVVKWNFWEVFMYKKSSMCRSWYFPWFQASSGVLDCPWCISGDLCVVGVGALLTAGCMVITRKASIQPKLVLASTTSSTVLWVLEFRNVIS